MAQVNPLTREVLIKLVYYGPGLGGKTTTLQRVHGVSPAETRGKIVSLATPVDRTLYFDFLPLRVGPVKGYPVRLQLFTVPGQVYFNATRKLVLTGADGVVFVADSQRERQDANVESFQNLEANLAEQNRKLEDIPLVFQFNKRDLPNVATVEQLNESLNRPGAPYFCSAAAKGEGVLEPLDELVRLVLDDLEKREVFGDSPGPQEKQPSFGPASDGMGESLTRASEELWSGRGSSRPAPSLQPGQTVASPPPAATHSPPHTPQTQADLPPVQLGPAPEPGVEPLTANGAANGDAGPATHSSPPASLPTAARTSTFGPSTHPSTPQLSGPSWASLFPEEQRGSVQEIELALSRGETSSAVLHCEGLVSELLAGVTDHADLPVTERPVTLVMAIGLPGERWLGLRHQTQRAKQGEPISPRQALEAYAVLLEVNRLCSRLKG